MWNLISIHLDARYVHGLLQTWSLEIILDEPDGFLGDEAQLEACFGPFRDNANLDAR
jgi:hypothetical protein